MSVIGETDIEYRKFSGFDEPQWPSGYWVGQGAVTGDATGGDMTMQITFNPVTALFNSQYYSLEQMFVNQVSQNSDIMGMLMANFDRGSALYHLSLVGTQSAQGNLELGDALNMRGLFLGQQRSPNSAQSISLTLDNVDGIVLTAKLEGYVWSARSTSVPGGPQRPPTGLYRS